MAIRRATQKQQVVEMLAGGIVPGERVVACVHAESGPSPWLDDLLVLVPVIGDLIFIPRKAYFLALTESSVVIVAASRRTNRPGGVVASFPIGSFPLSDVALAPVWSKVSVLFPAAAKPTRLNVSSHWRAELDQFLAGVQQAAPSDAR